MVERVLINKIIDSHSDRIEYFAKHTLALNSLLHIELKKNRLSLLGIHSSVDFVKNH